MKRPTSRRHRQRVQATKGVSTEMSATRGICDVRHFEVTDESAVADVRPTRMGNRNRQVTQGSELNTAASGLSHVSGFAALGHGVSV